MKKQIEDLTQQLVQIDTTGGKTALAAEVYQQFLVENGISARLDEYKEDCVNVIAKIGPKSKKSILISGHLDVVPIGNPDLWKYDAFSGKIIDGEMWGRGSVDMKGGTSMLAGVMIELLEHEGDLNCEIRLAATAEEETGLLGAAHLAAGDIMDDVSHILIAEPTGLGVAIMEKGLIWANIEAIGKQAHASRTDLGDNAIEGLAELLPDFYELIPDISLPEVGKSTMNVGVMIGGTVANVVPQFASMICDFRLTPGVEVKDMIRSIEEVLEKHRRKTMNYVANFDHSAPAVISSNNELGSVLAKHTGNITGITPDLGGMYYATDGAAFLEGREASFAIFGPGSTELLHQTNERLDLKELDFSRKIVKNSLLEINDILGTD